MKENFTNPSRNLEKLCTISYRYVRYLPPVNAISDGSSLQDTAVAFKTKGLKWKRV